MPLTKLILRLKPYIFAKVGRLNTASAKPASAGAEITNHRNIFSSTQGAKFPDIIQDEQE